MKIVTILSIAILAIAMPASAKPVKQEPKSCEAAIEQSKKKVKKSDLFVGFATEEIARKIRKDFPDLRMRRAKELGSCKPSMQTDKSPPDLFVLTIKNTRANALRLRKYQREQAG